MNILVTLHLGSLDSFASVLSPYSGPGMFLGLSVTQVTEHSPSFANFPVRLEKQQIMYSAI
jgi:hypothetical protein